MEKRIREFLLGYETNKKDFCCRDGCILNGCMQMYQATGGREYLEFIRKYLQAVIGEDGKMNSGDMEKLNIDSVNTMKVLFYIYDLTGEEKYAKAIGRIQDKIRGLERDQHGNFIWEDGLERLFPFYMEYETRYHKKENYNDIITQLLNGREKGFKTSYLMALIDVIDAMSIEIFEHYKTLEKCFKEETKKILPGFIRQVKEQTKGMEEGEFVGNCMEVISVLETAYAIIKACRIGVLSKEKYERTGLEAFRGITAERLFQSAEEGESNGMADRKAECIGIFMMAYAQKLMMQKQ